MNCRACLRPHRGSPRATKCHTLFVIKTIWTSLPVNLTMPRAGSRRKKTRTHVVDNEGAQSALASNETLKVPKSLIVREKGPVLWTKAAHILSHHQAIALPPKSPPTHYRSVEVR